MEIGAGQNQVFLEEAPQPSCGCMGAPTDCPGASVKDIAGHLLGWAEAIVSPRVMMAQTEAALPIRKECPTLVDAQNQIQVEALEAVGAQTGAGASRWRCHGSSNSAGGGVALKPIPF